MPGVAYFPFTAQGREVPVPDAAHPERRLERVPREMRMPLRMWNAANVGHQGHPVPAQQFEKCLERVIRVTDRE